jgi:GTP cyclohydrolase II
MTLEVLGDSPLRTRRGEFRCIVFRDTQTPHAEHCALVAGEPGPEGALVRLHSECLTGDAFGSLHCDCGEQLAQAQRRIVRAGAGVVVYLRQEGRGIGLGNKIRAYRLQALGLDTFEANRALGLPDDARRYDLAAEMLRVLGIRAVRLLTNNPEKADALDALGIRVSERVPMSVTVTRENARYLSTKRAHFGEVCESAKTRSVEKTR